MSGLKVQCPNCKRKDFVTTDRFDPDVTPNGGMVKCFLPYQIDWLCSSSTLCAQMTCPECLAPLAPQRVLNVLYPARVAGDMFAEESPAVVVSTPPAENVEEPETPKNEPYVCDVCGKSFKTPLALSGHKRSHK
jgi:hypothetical protein